MGYPNRHEELRRRRAVHGHGVAAVVIALTAAVLFGALDQYLGTRHSAFLTSISGMSALWLLVPFLAGARQASRRRAALVGLMATWLSVLAYVLMVISPMEGTHLGARPPGLAGSWNQLSLHLLLVTAASQWLWFAGGLLTGPLYGWLGYLWRSRRSWAAALVAVLPMLLEPAVRWLAAHFGRVMAGWLAFQGPGNGLAVVLEIAVGLTLTGVVVTAMARTRTRVTA